MKYTVIITTEDKRIIEFSEVYPGGFEKDGITLQCEEIDNVLKVSAFSDNSLITGMCHRISVGLRNFSTVIIPDGGRSIIKEWHPVYFWKFNSTSNVSNICLPLYIFNGQNLYANLAFGVIGDDIETSFRCIEPNSERALMAFYRRLTLEIKNEREYSKSSVCEYLYYRDYQEQQENKSWVNVISEFSQIKKEKYNIQYPVNNHTLDPLWCSWTDWHSDDVTEEVILDNVKEGLAIGITNYIIDDGWFGPGLDSDFSIKLNIGGWNADKTKIKDIAKLSDKIKEMGGRSIIWCAPHAVGESAECRGERLPYLMRDEKGALIETSNKFNVLCLRSPEARRIMVDICKKLARDYRTDGAKYDLFNCIPLTECQNPDHKHDTDSMVDGLNMLIKEIYEETTKINPDYIIELKQNYGGPLLASYGTMMRAGDTPYCPQGNFLRTAYIAGYTPFAINDYQTITSFDTIDDTVKIIASMLAVGVPSYSMDLCRLSEEHKKVISALNHWYIENIVRDGVVERENIDNIQNLWRISKKNEDIYFVLGNIQRFSVESGRKFQILNGSCANSLEIKFKRRFNVTQYNMFFEKMSSEVVEAGESIETNATIIVCTP